MTPARVVQRVLSNVVMGPDGCVVTTYSSGSHGYGQVGWHDGGKRTMALTHRVAWEAEHGPIPDGLTVDHLCRNRRCINPLHLRLLSNVDNARLNGQELKTTCPQGHPYAGDNLYVNPKGWRYCRQCAKDRRVRTAGLS